MTKNTKQLFSMDLRLYATAYVVAESPEEAMAKLREVTDGNWGLEFANGHQVLNEGKICMDGREFPHLFKNAEEIALSPALTIDKQFLPITMLERVELEPEPANDS
jgi:hypothetical protein